MEKPKKTVAELEQMLQEAVDPNKEWCTVRVAPVLTESGGARGTWTAAVSGSTIPDDVFQKFNTEKANLQARFDCSG